MALIPATMTINFVSNYAGPHRVCWRTGNVGPYDCTTIVNCLGGGNPCQAIIAIMVDNSTCVDVDFNGYVQAACEVEGSLNGQVPFSVIFTPNPPCSKYNIICAAVGILSYNVTNPGAGYGVGTNPPLAIVGGGGAGAAGYGVVGDGGILSWTVTNGGAGYNGGGSATFLNVPAQNILATGSLALFDVTVVLGVITMITLSASPLSPGINYTIGDTLDFNNANLGGSGAGAIITVNTINTGQIQYIVSTAPGSGYSSLPNVTVSGPAPLQALGAAVLDKCPDFAPGLDCSGQPVGPLGGLPLNGNYKMCTAIAPVLPPAYNVVPDGCCYDCITSVEFTNNGGSAVPGVFIQCKVGPQQTAVLLQPGLPEIHLCVVNNSWAFPVGSNITVVVNPTPAVCP